MTSLRRLTFATLLAITALNFAPSLASAQEPARGKFTLPHEVHWESVKIAAGDYEFSFNPQGTFRMLTLSKLSGTRAGYMLVVPATEDRKASDRSRLILETMADGSYVSAMQLPEFGMTLRFDVPSHASERQIAKAAPSAASGQ
jgi:hypothetical protein